MRDDQSRPPNRNPVKLRLNRLLARRVQRRGRALIVAALSVLGGSAPAWAQKAYSKPVKAEDKAPFLDALVGIHSTTVTEGASMEDALDAVAADPAAHQLRDQLGADVVVLVSDNSDYCGIAYFMNSVSAVFAPYAYGVVSSRCLSVSTLAHEVGHIQGLAHDRETAGAGVVSSRPYAFGYRICPTSGTGVRDIMSYACTSGTATRINEFSNPNRIVNGYVFGIAYEVDPLSAADAARALDDNAAVVASSRQSVLSPPDTPTLLRVTGYSSTIDCSNTARPADECASRWADAILPLLDDDPVEHRRARGVAEYYVGMLRANGGRSKYCESRPLPDPGPAPSGR